MTTKVENSITRAIEDGPLFQFLGAENMDRLKKEIVDVILKAVVGDLNNLNYCIIDPGDMIGDLVNECMHEAKERIKPRLEEALYKQAMAKLGLSNED